MLIYISTYYDYAWQLLTGVISLTRVHNPPTHSVITATEEGAQFKLQR